MGRRYEKMPDGTVVAVPDNISREALQRVRAKYTPKTRQERKAKGLPRRSPDNSVRAEVQDKRQKWKEARAASPLSRVADALSIDPAGLMSAGATFNFDDELAGLVGGGVRAVKGIFTGDKNDTFSRGYNVAKGVREADKTEYRRENPGAALAYEAAGGVALPFAGTGNTAFKGAQALRKAGATGAAKKVGRAAARMRASGPVTRGITTGAAVGALNAAGNADDIRDVPGALAEGGLVGGALGGVLGGAVTAGSAATRIIRDRRTPAQGGSEAIKARAYKRVGSLIDNIRGKDDKPIGAAAVTGRIREANKTGSDTRLMDQSAGLRSEAAFLGREINLPNSNRLQDLAEDRILKRQGNFSDQVTSRAKTGKVDALDAAERITSQRLAQGKIDYADGGPMDQKVDWTPQMDSFFKEAGPTTNRALRKAYDIMLDERRNPVELSSEGVFTGVPSWRTLDYLKRGYRDLIESAVGGKNFAQASRISSELNALKSMMIEQNPEYGKLLVAQRDPFQQVQAIELGQKLFKGLRNGPREALREVKKLSPDVQDNARIGFIYELLNLDVKADPVAAIRVMMRNPAQRKIVEFAFGGKKAVNSFEQYVENEVKAALSDRLVSQGRQSATGLLKQAGASQQEIAAELAGKTGQGFFFGGIGGATANAFNTARQMAGRVNPEVQNEIARILMSKGDDLEEGIAAAAKFFAQRLARDRTRSATAARAVATPFGASIGDD